jgi:hypothetical protein
MQLANPRKREPGRPRRSLLVIATRGRKLGPGLQSIPGFDVNRFLTTRHQWFACARLRDPYLPRSTARLFPRRSPPRLLTAAAHGGLRPPPAQRPRRATRQQHPAPPSPAQHRIQRPDLLHPASFNVRGTPSDESQQSAGSCRSLLLRRQCGRRPSGELGTKCDRPQRRGFLAAVVGRIDVAAPRLQRSRRRGCPFGV